MLVVGGSGAGIVKGLNGRWHAKSGLVGVVVKPLGGSAKAAFPLDHGTEGRDLDLDGLEGWTAESGFFGLVRCGFVRSSGAPP